MKPLSAAPAPVFSLTAPPASSPLTAQTKAQKLRTHAQGKRGAGSSGGSGFHDQLRARGGNAAAENRPERAETRAQGKSEAAAAKGATEQASEKPPSSGVVAVRSDREPLTSDAAAKPEYGGDGESRQPFVQEIVAQVLEGVDPALRLKPTAVARAAGTVAGNTAEMKRGIEFEPAPTMSTQPAYGEQGASGVDALLPHAKPHPMQNDEDAGEVKPVKGSTPEAGAARGGEPTATAAPTPANGARPDRAAAATESAASALTLPTSPARVVEQRVTLTPTLSVVSAAGGARLADAAKAAADAKPRSTVAEQVEHGLKVAMTDLPAPSGERLVTLRLHPSSLGSLRISMHVSGDAVNVRFQVGSAKAKSAIGKAIDDLKASIAQQGLRVESMEIEEESALAAPDSGIEGRETPLGGPQAALGAAGKGFANPLDAPRGPDGSRADDGTGRTPTSPEAETEDGVLQVLTFRLDAVG